ncbi:aerolysin-like protein [Entelurus aequoreus]|uniref:aerolysin-like protein n=1 Tax=Entelurus aequoreus TaxID=161455 RepID=UPI002B1CF494|nr:aerolysin-like protein [Entelurus aequoreus]
MSTKLHLIGGNGGDPFTFDGFNNGATLKKIGVAVGGWQIHAVRAELTDGRMATFGRAHTFNEFTFSPGERITKLSLWGNGAGSRLGGIRLWTSSGREFFEHMNGWPMKTEYSIDVGSGVCLGLVGRHGHDIDCMGFHFISPIKSSVLTNLTYPGLAMYKPQVSKEYIKSVAYRNNTSEAQEQKCTYNRSVTKKTTWSTTNKIESTISVTVSAGIPKLVEVSSGFSLTVGAEHSNSMSHVETIKESDEVSVKVPAGKTLNVELSVGRAVIDLEYSASVWITCMNGHMLVFPCTGNYTGVAYTAVDVSTTESDIVTNAK